jgi:hypothetical protein
MRLPLAPLMSPETWTALWRKLGLSRSPRDVTTARLRREAQACLACEQLEDRTMLSGFSMFGLATSGVSIGDAVSVAESGGLAFTVSLGWLARTC